MNSSILSPPSLLLVLLLTIISIPSGVPFTVIMSDSGVPSALVDAPQTGFSINNVGAHTDPHEQEAVYDIMKATGNGWATEIPDVCRGRWHGIECMPDKDQVFHVVSLSFGALSDDTAFPTCDHTSSYLSPSLTKLPHIKTLFFYRCFSYNPQPIPSFLGQLGPTLQTLVLRENGHVGLIPTELGNLTRLKILDLHKNNLNGSLPVSLGRLTNLRSLDLSVNRLSGRVPALKYPVLNIMDLSQNHLSGLIPTSLGDCPLLIKMDLSRNRLSGPIPESIDNLKSLMLMDLSYNRLSGPFPAALGRLSSLQALILKGNRMDSTILPGYVFNGLKDLMILVLSDMALQGSIPESLGLLTNLRVIHMDRNRLNGSIPSSFQELKSLNDVRLNDNQLTGRVPFKKETIWKIGRKLKVHNNSGLCYDAHYNSVGDDPNPPFFTDIDYCNVPKTGKTAQQHYSVIWKHISGSVWRSSSSSARHESPVTLPLMLLILILVLF